MTGNVASRLFVNTTATQHIFREMSNRNVTIEGAGFVDKQESEYAITINGAGCISNQTYVSGSNNVTVYVDDSSSSYLTLENVNFSGCTGNIYGRVVYSSQPSTDLVQIGTAVYLTDTMNSNVVILSDDIQTLVTVQGSGFVDSDATKYDITVFCGSTSLGNSEDSCIPYNTVDDTSSGRSTTTLVGKISQSVDAASTCKSGDVIYAYITYSGQSSETVAIGYVLGLKDTSTSIAILGTSSETITLTGVGFTFNVSNEELGSWAGVDAHTLRVTLSSDTCSGRATTISNVASST